MSDNELDLYQGGGLAPISPAPVPDLYEKTAEDSWQDHLPVPSEDQYPSQTHQGHGFKLFGNPIPQGTPEPVVNETLAAIAGTFYRDMLQLRHRADWAHAAVQWFNASARKAPKQEARQHSYNLHDQQHDLIANSFANAMARVGASQEFVSNSIWWLEELYRRLENKPLATAMAAPGTATSQDPTDALTDAQFEQVVEANELAKAKTLDYLRNIWGSSFHANLRTVDNYFSQLPIAEKNHLNQLTTGWIYGTNTPQVIVGIFNMAIGHGTLPTDGAGIAREIEACEACMKNERDRWMKDERLQARYRHLLDLRGY